jgi:hypothetical protein
MTMTDGLALATTLVPSVVTVRHHSTLMLARRRQAARAPDVATRARDRPAWIAPHTEGSSKSNVFTVMKPLILG